MQCPNCLEPYDTDGIRQPRIIITCGHSFCRKCVQGLRDGQETLTCPQCRQISAEDDAPNVALMSYIEMQKTRSIPSKVRQINVPRQAVVCQHCNQNDAKFICFDCLPHNGFRFCSECMRMEHDRPFGPVQKHKPRPIEDVMYGAILPDCPHHPTVPCDLFSFVENRFACDECKGESDFDPEQFVDIEMAVQQVREEIPPLISKVQLLRERLQETQGKVRDHLSHLDQSKMTAIDKARVEFQDFEMSLRKRLAFVESQVEDSVSSISIP